MILYHGSSIPGIQRLRPFSSNHDKPYVYLTYSSILAALYAHNPMTRPNGFFTYWWGRDGVLRYDEYFEDQLERVYAGKRGFVYQCEGEYPQLEQMPWVYLAETEVAVNSCVEIPDLYVQLLQYEQDGLLIVRRWRDASEKQREIWENVVRRSLTETDLTTPVGQEYAEYIRVHFPNLNQPV